MNASTVSSQIQSQTSMTFFFKTTFLDVLHHFECLKMKISIFFIKTKLPSWEAKNFKINLILIHSIN